MEKSVANVLVTLLATTAIAALIGIVAVMVFGLDGATFTKGEQLKLLGSKSWRIVSQWFKTFNSATDFYLIPTNVFADFAGTRPTSTNWCGNFWAFCRDCLFRCSTKSTKRSGILANLIESLYKVVMRIVTLVLRLTPYGVFALMTNVLATSDFEAIVNLGKFILASYSALIVVLLVHSIILLGVKVNPINFFKKAFPALSFAFTSRSSAGTLPMNIETQTKALGVDEATANFAGSFGISIGQNGCAGVYPAMLATIVAPTVGVNVFDLKIYSDANCYCNYQFIWRSWCRRRSNFRFINRFRCDELTSGDRWFSNLCGADD